MKTIVLTDKKQMFNGVTYYLCGKYFQKNGTRLHRVVWEHHNGEIPEGYHVHHKDSNRSNNDIENLELVEGKKHLKLHGANEERKAKSRENIKKAIECAKEWHSSEKGRQWHSEHGRKTWENREPVEYACDFCGKKFQSLKLTQTGNHFCSNNCKASFRRHSGVDNETRNCEKCGKEFATNKYSKARYCSLICSRHSRKWRGGTAYEG